MKKKGPRSVPDFSRHPAAPSKGSAPTPEQKSSKARNDAARPQTKPQTGTSKSGQRGK